MNISVSQPLESYTIRPAKTLIPGISDLHLSLALPIVVHWVTSGFFEICDRVGIWKDYRLHTSAEEFSKNRVSRAECFRVTIQCQVLQTLFGLTLGALGDEDVMRSDDHDLSLWIKRVHDFLRHISWFLNLSGIQFIDSATETDAMDWSSLGIVMNTGKPDLPNVLRLDVVIAEFIYWIFIPACQFIIAIIIADAFMYCLHRIGHTNKWIYKHIHSQHHRLYVPYSWGASYNHPWDSIVVDGLSYGIGCSISGISSRMSILLFSYASFKNVLDHCGYVFPWDIMKPITGTDAGFHDVHHQSWGLKTNFGAHFSLWDRICGTHFNDEELIARFREKNRAAAEEMKSRKND